jgi:oxygen-independent coproporphyrinogen-3 oxidase
LYCDFFSTTQFERIDGYVDKLIEEIHLRKHTTHQAIQTIYIGGGTPSLLKPIHIERILEAIGIEHMDEITMEINPGDANKTYLQALYQAGIQRLSIGIQSFQDELLKTIGRRHNAQQAIQTIHSAQEVGFKNISIDLIYALPTQTMEQWKADVEMAVQLGIQHISSYGLIYEEGTPLTHLLEQGAIEPIDEDMENEMYDYLCERLQQAGFEHYEVSNFALPGYKAIHNGNYWNGTPYIGIGAGAHSYYKRIADDDTQYIRSSNPDNLDAYMACNLQQDKLTETELLTPIDRYNEYIMLALRTNQGISLDHIAQQLNLIGQSHHYPHTRNQIQKYIDNHLLQTHNNRIIATQKGLHILNQIIEALMMD